MRVVDVGRGGEAVVGVVGGWVDGADAWGGVGWVVCVVEMEGDVWGEALGEGVRGIG